jgi:PhnB protein
MTSTSSEVAYSTVDPWVISLNTDAEIAFIINVFGGKERGDRALNADGSVGHAEVAVGGSVIMLFDVAGDAVRPTSALRVYVDDIAGVIDRATGLGARLVTRPTELAFCEVGRAVP